jgi:hypothetical protein
MALAAGRVPVAGGRWVRHLRRVVTARAYDTVDERASCVARSFVTHGVDARRLDEMALDMLRRAGVSSDDLFRASNDPETTKAAFAEWSKAFASEVAIAMRAHGVEAVNLDGRAEAILAGAGIFPDWLRYYQKQLPKNEFYAEDVFPSQDTKAVLTVPPRRVRGMTLLDEADSEFGKLQVLRVDDDARGADAPFAGATVLMREHTPDAVLSEYRPGDSNAAGGVFDLFAMLPPLIAHMPLGYPIGVVGLGAGTVAREIVSYYPDGVNVNKSGLARRVVGWELDPAIVELARAHFGLQELEQSGRVVVRVGDAFVEVRRAFAEGRLLAGVVVDVFDEHSVVLPELLRMDTWDAVGRALAPGGRVIANLSTGRGKGAHLEAAVRAAECAAIACGGGRAVLWRSGAHGVYNEVIITGPPPTDLEWSKQGGLPNELAKYKGEWYEVRAPAGKQHGWILG